MNAEFFNYYFFIWHTPLCLHVFLRVYSNIAVVDITDIKPASGAQDFSFPHAPTSLSPLIRYAEKPSGAESKRLFFIYIDSLKKACKMIAPFPIMLAFMDFFIYFFSTAYLSNGYFSLFILRLLLVLSSPSPLVTLSYLPSSISD